MTSGLKPTHNIYVSWTVAPPPSSYQMWKSITIFWKSAMITQILLGPFPIPSYEGG